ncbi:MAG: Obg family GTPase CgtA, partial [Lachnospiraceae bacterium]|nr:Obg family GTPase CgtA [Lachnospiraceae bacterium]
ANYHFTTLSPVLGVVDLPDDAGFVMADIPGLIEGAAEGAGLGHEFLSHIERTKVLIHVVDAAGSEGRDPLADMEAINQELAKYGAGEAQKPQVIAANKIDLITPDEDGMDPIARIRDHCEPLGIAVFPISAATGSGIRELLYHVSGMLKELPRETMVYAQEYDPETELSASDEPFTIQYDAKAGEYVVEGPKIEKMLGYTNLETEKGFAFFQKFLEDNGISARLREMGIKDGDTVRLYGHTFEFYD